MTRFVLYCIFTQHLLSCRHHFRVESYPPGARVYFNGEEIGTTPIDRTVWWYPFKKVPLKVTLPNYRTMQISADQQINAWSLTKELLSFRYKVLLGIKPRATHQIYLVRKHGPAGTWTPDDAQQIK